MNQETLDNTQLKEMADRFRYISAEIICRSGSGHLGGALSLVEIMITLYYRIMRVRPEDPDWEDRDPIVGEILIAYG